jgi:hypothetical protein
MLPNENQELGTSTDPGQMTLRELYGSNGELALDNPERMARVEQARMAAAAVPQLHESFPEATETFSFGDLVMSVPRGVAAFGSDVVNLAAMPFGGEVPDRFGMSGSSSTVGQISETFVNFLTGFLPGIGIAGKIGRAGRFAKIGAAAATKADDIYTAAHAAYNAGNIAKAGSLAMQGKAVSLLPELAKVGTVSAITDFLAFDGHEARLSNLLRDYAGLQDPITAFLAADPDDSEVVGRLKNSIEGLGLGLAVDGIISSLRIFRAGKKAKAGGLDPTRAMVEEAGRIRAEHIAQIKRAVPGISDEQAAATLTIIQASGASLDDLTILNAASAAARMDADMPLWAGAGVDPRGPRTTDLGPQGETRPAYLDFTEDQIDEIAQGRGALPPDPQTADLIRQAQAKDRAARSLDDPTQPDLFEVGRVEKTKELVRKAREAAASLPKEPQRRDPTTGRFEPGEQGPPVPEGYQPTPVAFRAGGEEWNINARGEATMTVNGVEYRQPTVFVDEANMAELSAELQRAQSTGTPARIEIGRVTESGNAVRIKPDEAADLSGKEIVITIVDDATGDVLSWIPTKPSPDMGATPVSFRYGQPAVRQGAGGRKVARAENPFFTDGVQGIDDLSIRVGKAIDEVETPQSQAARAKVNLDNQRAAQDERAEAFWAGRGTAAGDPEQPIINNRAILGYTEFAEDGKIIVGLFKGAEVDTLVHEGGHIFRRYLINKDVDPAMRYGVSDDDIDLLSEWAGARQNSNGTWTWTREAEERFADGFMQFLRTNEAPAGVKLDYLWNRIASWLMDLFENVRQSPEIEMSPEIAKSFDKIMKARLNALKKAGKDAMPAPQPKGGESVLFQSVPGTPGGGPPARRVTTPGSTGLGKPAPSPGEPFAGLNINRFSSVGELNRAVGRFIRYTIGDMEEAPRSLESVARQAEQDAKELAELLGEQSSVTFDVKSLGLRASLLPGAQRELSALRQLAANIGNRMKELADKGSAASEAEVYEWLRGRMIAFHVIKEIKSRQREVARMLNSQNIVPVPDPSFRITPTSRRLAEEAEPILPGTSRPSPDMPPARPGAETPDSVPTPGELHGGTKRPGSGVVGPTSPEEIRNVIEAAGGIDAARRMMAKYKAASAAGGAGAVNKLASGAKSRLNRTGNVLVEYWMNSILSGPITQAVNLLANTATTIYRPLERALGASLTLNGKGVYESLRPLYHMALSMPEVMKFAKTAFMDGDSILDKSARATEMTTKLGPQREISAAALGVEQPLAAFAVDWIGKAVNLPSRLLTTADEMFKQLNYRAHFKVGLMNRAATMFPDDMAARAKYVQDTLEKTIGDGQAYAETTIVGRALRESEDLIMKGELDRANRDDWVANYLADPAVWDDDLGALSDSALAYARDVTFQTPLDARSPSVIRKFSSRIQSLVAQFPTLRFVIPFVRTPTNLLIFALDRLPGNVKNIRESMMKLSADASAADVAIRTEARGRLAVSFAGCGSLLMLADAEIITGAGPENREEREIKMQTGWRPYSIKIGGTYFSYRRTDPFSTIAGLYADLVESIKAGGSIDGVGDILDTISGAVISTVAHNITNKTYFTGFTSMVNAFSEPDRYGEAFAERLAASFVPSAMAQSLDIFEDDPKLREVRGMLDAVRARIPGIAANLPPRRNILGEPITRNKKMGFAFSPFEYSEINDDVILREFDLVGHGFSRPRTTKGSVDLTAFNTVDGQQAYDRWLELHGEMKIGGLTLRDRLSRTIRSRAYQRLDAAGDDEFESPRVRVLRAVIAKYREAAFQQVLKESPELKEAYVEDRTTRSALRRGVPLDQLRSLAR